MKDDSKPVGNPVDLAAEDPAIIQLYADQIPMYQSALEAAKQGLEARDERISELEGLVNQTKVDSNLKSGMIEFFKQVDRDYVKAIWDLQEKGRFGETKVKDFDNLKPFNDFYEEFKAQAGDDKSKVTSEMVSVLDGYRQVLDLLYESRTHQFEHLFQLEDSRKNLKRMSYMDIIKQVEQVNFAEMRKDSENYKIFKETFPKAFQDMIDRMDLVVNDAEKELEIADLKQQVEGLNHLLENNESETQPESSPAPAGLEGVYARLDAIQANVGKFDDRYIDLYKAILDAKADITEVVRKGQFELKEELLDLKQLYVNGQAPVQPQPYTPGSQPVQPEAPVQPNPAQPDAEDLDDLVDNEPSNPETAENANELYESLKQARNKAMETKDSSDCIAAINLARQAYEAGYKDPSKIFYEVATINFISGNLEESYKIFLRISNDKEASAELKAGAMNNIGYIFEILGKQDEASQYGILDAEKAPNLMLVDLLPKMSPVESAEPDSPGYCELPSAA